MSVYVNYTSFLVIQKKKKHFPENQKIRIGISFEVEFEEREIHTFVSISFMVFISSEELNE